MINTAWIILSTLALFCAVIGLLFRRAAKRTGGGGGASLPQGTERKTQAHYTSETNGGGGL